MADEEPKEDEEPLEEAPPKKAAPKIVGGLVGVVALGYVVAMMAIPSKFEPRKFSGPFVAELTPDRITVNLSDDSNKRILVMKLKAELDAYEETYVPDRTMDPLYMAQIKDALLGIASEKSRSEILGPDARPIFQQELRNLVEPIVFPVHVGAGAAATDVDPDSGLAPASRSARATSAARTTSTCSSWTPSTRRSCSTPASRSATTATSATCASSMPSARPCTST